MAGEEVFETVVLTGASVVAVLDCETAFLVRAAQSATEVQERHLRCSDQYVSIAVACRRINSRFAILAQHNALWKSLWHSSIYGVIVPLLFRISIMS